MEQRPDVSETTDQIQLQHDDIRAKRAWLDLMRDEFRPHCMLSANAYTRAREEVSWATTTLHTSVIIAKETGFADWHSDFLAELTAPRNEMAPSPVEA